MTKSLDEEQKSSKTLFFHQDLSKSLDRVERRLDSPREITIKKYSLEPDMIKGWKPRKIERKSNHKRNPFPIHYEDQ